MSRKKRHTEKRKLKKGGLAKKLLAMSMIPLLLMGAALSIMGAFYIRKGIYGEIEKNLYTASIGLSEKLKYLDDGDYVQNAQGYVYKGGTMISGNMSLIGNAYNELGLQFTIFYGKTRVLTDIIDDEGRFIIGTDASDEVIQKVLEDGDHYFSTNVIVNGTPYLGYYVPLYNRDKTIVGMVFAGRPAAETESFIWASTMSFVIFAVGLIILCLILFYVVIRSIVRNAKAAEKLADDIAAGNLQNEADTKLLKRKDELGDIAKSIEHIRQSLSDTVKMLNGNSQTISDYTEKQDELLASVNQNASEVSRAVEGVSEGAMNQAEEVQTASEQIGQIGRLIEDISNCLSRLEKTASDMQNAGDESTMIIQDLDATNSETVHAVEEIAKQIQATFNSAQLIKEAIDIITNIAEETNLLSLNASIEAARAGEQGRGFAVVAGEIQKLADQSNESAQRIRNVIDGLMSDAQKTVQIMETVQSSVSAQHEKLDETKNKFEDVSLGITSSLEGIGEINRSAKSLSNAREKIIEVIESLSAISEENAASAEETSASVQELSANITTVAAEAWNLHTMVEQLEETTEKFKV